MFPLAFLGKDYFQVLYWYSFREGLLLYWNGILVPTEEATNELQLALTGTSSDMDDALQAQFFGWPKTGRRKRALQGFDFWGVFLLRYQKMNTHNAVALHTLIHYNTLHTTRFFEEILL